MANDFNYLFKFIVIGDTGVGKSCVVLQFIEQKMNEGHDVTIGVQFASRTLEIKNKMIKFQVWDTAGQQNFRSITRSYYRSAIGAFLVYDITKRKSFQHLQDWLKQIKANGNNNLQIMIIGNKNDLEQERQVSKEEGRKYAEQQYLPFFQLTARDYKRVEAVFVKMANNIIERIEKGEISENTPGIKISQDLRINPLADRPKKKCC